MKSIRFAGWCLAALFVVQVLFSAGLVHAQGNESSFLPLVPQACANDVTQCNFCTFMDLVGNLIRFFFVLLTIVAILMIMYAGFLLVTSAGDVGAMTRAKSMFTNVVIGFIIVLSAWLIVDTVMKALITDQSKFGVWNEFESSSCGSIRSDGTFSQDAFNEQTGNSWATPGGSATLEILNNPPAPTPVMGP